MDSTQTSTILDRVISIIRESLYLPNIGITAETSLVDDLGVDSLDLIEVMTDLEETFGLELPDNAMARFQTVGEIAQYMRRRLCCRDRVVEYVPAENTLMQESEIRVE
jgi:acyl carrier protein